MPGRSNRSHSAIRAGDATAVSSLFQRQGPAGSNPALRTISPFRRGRLKTRRRPDTRGARPDRTGSLRLTGQDTALSRRQCGFDSRRDRISTRSGSPLWRRRSNVPEHSIRPRSASRAGDATAVSSLFQEQGPAGSNPALRTIFLLPHAQVMQRQYHPCFRNRVLRVRIPPCAPSSFSPTRR